MTLKIQYLEHISEWFGSGHLGIKGNIRKFTVYTNKLTAEKTSIV